MKNASKFLKSNEVIDTDEFATYGSVFNLNSGLAFSEFLSQLKKSE